MITFLSFELRQTSDVFAGLVAPVLCGDLHFADHRRSETFIVDQLLQLCGIALRASSRLCHQPQEHFTRIDSGIAETPVHDLGTDGCLSPNLFRVPTVVSTDFPALNRPVLALLPGLLRHRLATDGVSAHAVAMLPKVMINKVLIDGIRRERAALEKE